jgi:hypothetical protein
MYRVLYSTMYVLVLAPFSFCLSIFRKSQGIGCAGRSRMGNPITFARAVLMVRGSAGVELAVQFYNKALGLNVIRRTEDWAELSCGGNFRFSVKSVDGNEANLCTGYSPILSFTVSDMDSRIANCIQMVRLFFCIEDTSQPPLSLNLCFNFFLCTTPVFFVGFSFLCNSSSYTLGCTFGWTYTISSPWKGRQKNSSTTPHK